MPFPLRRSLLVRGLAAAALVFPRPAAAQQTRTGIVVDTSSTYAAALRQLTAAYLAEHPGLELTIHDASSVDGLNDVRSKAADLAFVDSIPADGITFARQIFAVPLAVVVNAKSGVTGLTRAQVAGLFSGRYSNWKELGGADLPIRLFSRPAGSAITTAFTRDFGAAPASGEALVTSAETIEAVSGAPGGTGFTTLTAVRATPLRILAVDGHDAGGELGPSAYPFYAPGFVVSDGPPTLELSRFLAFAETRRELLAKYGISAIRSLP